MPAATMDRRGKTGWLLLAAGLGLLLVGGYSLAAPRHFTAESLLLVRDVVNGAPDPERPSTGEIMAAGEKRLRACLPQDDPSIALKRTSASSNVFTLSASAPTPEAAMTKASAVTRETFDRYVEIYRTGSRVAPVPELPNVNIIKYPELLARADRVVPWRGVLAAAVVCMLAGLGLLGQARRRLRAGA